MAEFLNRSHIIDKIIDIINNADREIIKVVPYIKISPTIWNELIKKKNTEKEIILIYREETMKQSEKEKLHSLSNLTILHHPNVHAKCYLNESSI